LECGDLPPLSQPGYLGRPLIDGDTVTDSDNEFENVSNLPQAAGVYSIG
jgi:hypothetical protein